MRKIIGLPLLFLALALMASPASARDWYVSIKRGKGKKVFDRSLSYSLSDSSQDGLKIPIEDDQRNGQAEKNSSRQTAEHDFPANILFRITEKRPNHPDQQNAPQSS